MKINNFRYWIEVEDSEDIEDREYYEYPMSFIDRKKKKEEDLKISGTPSFSEYVKANMKVKKEEKGSYKNGRRK